MLLKYRPEDKAEKKERLLKRAQAEADGKSVEAKKPIVVKYGLNHVTYLIEQVFFLSLLLSFLLSLLLIVVPRFYSWNHNPPHCVKLPMFD